MLGDHVSDRFCNFITALGLRAPRGRPWIADLVTNPQGEHRVVVGVEGSGLMRASQARALAQGILDVVRRLDRREGREATVERIDPLTSELHPQTSWVAAPLRDDKTGRWRVAVGVLEPGLLKREDALRFAARIGEIASKVGAEGDL